MNPLALVGLGALGVWLIAQWKKNQTSSTGPTPTWNPPTYQPQSPQSVAKYQGIPWQVVNCPQPVYSRKDINPDSEAAKAFLLGSYPVGSEVIVDQIDGIWTHTSDPTLPGWMPSIDCPNGPSMAPKNYSSL